MEKSKGWVDCLGPRKRLIEFGAWVCTGLGDLGFLPCTVERLEITFYQGLRV